MKPPSSNSASSVLTENEIAGLAWDQTAAGICLVGAEGEVRQCNRAFADLMGHPEADLVGMPLLRLQPAEHAMAMQALHREIIEQEDPAVWLGKKTHFANKRGRPIATYTRNARVVNEEGEVHRLITVVDLSDIARAISAIDGFSTPLAMSSRLTSSRLALEYAM